MNKILLLLSFLMYGLVADNALAQTYVVGGDYDYAPITFLDDDGNASGLDIDILNTISRRRGVNFQYQLSSWDSALNYIQSGEIDIITGIIFSEDREEFVDFTIPIHTEYYSVFIRDDLNFIDISSLYDYKPIVLEKDISIERYLIPMGLYKDYVVAQSLPDALHEIEQGNADYVLAPNSLGINQIKNHSYQNIEIKGPPVIPSIYCMAVKKGNDRLLQLLNEEITDLRQTGKLFEIQEKWEVHQRDEFKYRRIARYFGIILGITVILLLFFFVLIWGFRSQIRKNTESLNQKNKELEGSEKQLKELNATKDKLFSIIAHDLRAPFSSIVGLSNLLTREAEEKRLVQVERYAGMISSSSKKAMDLLSNLMEWSSSQSGRLSFSPQNFDIKELVEENLLFFSEIANQKIITLVNNIDAPLVVHADRNMLNTVLRNLISNAIKFTGNGGRIEITGVADDSHVEISVSDNGTGMTNAQTEKIFASEVHDSSPGTENESGSGLGLILCKEFIEKHQGRIWVDSEYGKGSVFYFSLPL